MGLVMAKLTGLMWHAQLMDEETRRWHQDNKVLAEIGGHLFQSDTRLAVTIPRQLAELAVKAWDRDEEGDYQFDSETADDQRARHRAASLALIGAALKERGEWFEQDVHVDLDAWFVGHALDCADDAGLTNRA